MHKYKRFCAECKLKNELDLITEHEKPGEKGKSDYCPRCGQVKEMVLVEYN